MHIRDATKNDIPAITAIYGRSVREEFASFELEPPDEMEMMNRFQVLKTGGYPYLVAQTDEGTVAGYAYAGPYRPRPAYGKTLETTIYVAPDFWQLGAGSALLAALVERSFAQGYREMIAVIAHRQDIAAGKTPSVVLHQKHGFASVGRLSGVGHKLGLWLDVILMQRSLR